MILTSNALGLVPNVFLLIGTLPLVKVEIVDDLVGPADTCDIAIGEMGMPFVEGTPAVTGYELVMCPVKGLADTDDDGHTSALGVGMYILTFGAPVVGDRADWAHC